MKDYRRAFNPGLLGVLILVACAAGVMPEPLSAETVTLSGEVDQSEIHGKLDAIDAKLDRVLNHLTPGTPTPGSPAPVPDTPDPIPDPPSAGSDLWINPSFLRERPIITGVRGGVYGVDPDYAALLSQYTGIRYLNWSGLLWWGVNDTWENRVNADLNQGAPGGGGGASGGWPSLTEKWHKTGLPLEAIIDIANATHTHVWWTGPMHADAEFFKKAGELFAQRLDPDLHVVVEVGNEVWDANRGRPYHQAGDDFADAMRLYARDSAAKFAAFIDGGFPADRLTRVVGGQLHFYDILPRHVLAHLADDEFDAITCSGYFGNSAHKGEHWQTGKHGLNHSVRELNRFADLAKSIGKQLLIYELNHHVTDNEDLAGSDEVIDGVGTMIDTARARGVPVIALFQGAGNNNSQYHWCLYRPDLTPRRAAERLNLPTLNN